jgi:hypothetical protein
MGGEGVSRIAYLAKRSVLEEKGRVVNQKNLNELRGFSTAPLFLVSPIDFESKMGVDKKLSTFFIFYGFCR